MTHTEDESTSKSGLIEGCKATSLTRSRSSNRLGRVSFIKQWWLELLCMTLVLLSSLATILTLAVHRAQILSQWPLSVSLNALLAIYGTILKGSMLLVVAEGLGQLKWLWFRNKQPLYDIDLFDSATRGPKGALDLLFASRRRIKRSLFPIIGASLTLLAIGIDPFTQQVVHYYTCPTENHNLSQASISRVNRYTYPGSKLISQDPIKLPTIAAFFTGMYGASKAAIEPPFSCAGGNCDFPENYSSTAVCGECVDVTSTLNYSHFIKGGLPFSVFTLPSGLSLANANPAHAYQLLIARKLNLGLENPSFIVEFITTATLNFASFNQTSRFSRNIGAARCELYPCVKTYTASVRSGRLDERTLSSFPLPFINATHNSIQYLNVLPPVAKVPCLSQQEKRRLLSEGYNLKANPEFLQLHWKHTPDIPAHCVYSTDKYLWEGLESSFLHYLDGQVDASDETGIKGPIPLMALYNYGNITFASLERVFESIATSLTSQMRLDNVATGAKGGEPVNGFSIENTTCIGVRWTWLIFPMSMFIATAVFFSSTLYRSKKASRDLWKSSSLALLYHGLDSETRAKDGELLTTKEMEDAAKRTLVRLQLHKEGWRLSCNNLVDRPVDMDESSTKGTDTSSSQTLRSRMPQSMTDHEIDMGPRFSQLLGEYGVEESRLNEST